MATRVGKSGHRLAGVTAFYTEGLHRLALKIDVDEVSSGPLPFEKVRVTVDSFAVLKVCEALLPSKIRLNQNAKRVLS